MQLYAATCCTRAAAFAVSQPLGNTSWPTWLEFSLDHRPLWIALWAEQQFDFKTTTRCCADAVGRRWESVTVTEVQMDAANAQLEKPWIRTILSQSFQTFLEKGFFVLLKSNYNTFVCNYCMQCISKQQVLLSVLPVNDAVWMAMQMACCMQIGFDKVQLLPIPVPIPIPTTIAISSRAPNPPSNGLSFWRCCCLIAGRCFCWPRSCSQRFCFCLHCGCFVLGNLSKWH